MYLKNGQIRFLKGAKGIEQVKKEYKSFHPERDSKEDDCMETIANVTQNDFIVAKRPTKKEEPITNNPYNPQGEIYNSTTWRI